MNAKLVNKIIAAMVFVSASAQAYTVNIITPANEQAYLRPAQNIEIVVDVSPEPTLLHTLVVRLNGEYVAANQTNLSIPTMTYDVGNYVLSAELQSETGQVIAQDSRTIYIIPQNNLIRQERERQAAQRAAYEALPWYKKLYINMRQDEVELDVSEPETGVAAGVGTLPSGTRPNVAPMASGVPTISGYGTVMGTPTNTTKRQVSIRSIATQNTEQ